LVHREGEWVPYWDGWIEHMRESSWRRFGWYVWDQGPGLPGDWNGRLAPSHEFIFHFNRIAGKARKTKESKWAGTTNHVKGLRAKDGTVGAYTDAGKQVQAKKIPDSVVRVMRHKARGIECEHPAVFPVALVSEIVTAFSDSGDLLYEPFCGSGTQMIAAEKEGRVCYGMELAPAYCDVIVTRWENATGKKAERVPHGAAA
jgi:DNA modification methylase